MTTYPQLGMEQTAGIPFDTSDFSMHSFSTSMTFGTFQSTTMDEWDEEVEDESEFEDDEDLKTDEDEVLLEDDEEDDDDEFEQYLFGEDDD